MAKVFPLRTAPSQMIASQSPFYHQVSTFICFGEIRIPSTILPTAFQLAGCILQRTIQFLCPALVIASQKSVQQLQRL